MAKKETEQKDMQQNKEQNDEVRPGKVQPGKVRSGKVQAEKAETGKEKTAGKSGKEKKSDTHKTHHYKAEYEALHDKYLRLSAEFDNYRKRTLKEKADLTKYAGESLLIGLLPVVDDFERALDLMPPDESCKAVQEGTTLIYNKLREFLRQNGVEEIEALHKTFDTDVHEAVTKIPAPEKKLKGKVVDVIQKGYFLNGKVLRYAKVVVGE